MMPPILLRFLPHYIAGLAILTGGVLFYGHSRYNAGQEDVRAGVAEQVALATAETARIDAERVKLSERIENELQPRLADATSRANSLAVRLREYTRRRALPETPGAPTEPPSAPGEPTDGRDPGSPVDAALTSHLEACARDATRLQGWQEWYKAL